MYAFLENNKLISTIIQEKMRFKNQNILDIIANKNKNNKAIFDTDMRIKLSLNIL